MKEATLEMTFEYDPDNHDVLTDGAVKEMVLDTVQSHPDLVWESIEVETKE